MNDEQIPTTPAPAPAQEQPDKAINIVEFYKSKLRHAYEAQIVELANEHVAAIKRIDEMATLLRRVPPALADRGYIYNGSQLDFDNLGRDDALEIIRSLGAGRWTKTPNSSQPDLIDYQATVEGVTVRLWASGPPDTCRVVEYFDTIPAQKIPRRRLVCKGDPGFEEAKPPCQHAYVEGSTVCTVCGS